MHARTTSVAAACAAFTSLLITGCGGGSTAETPPVPTTTDVTVSVIDGAIANALVCADANGNGRCDDDEVHGRTDGTGSATLTLATADVGKFNIVAMVGTDATDADHGAVPTAYVLSTPADHGTIVSPLTTLVQQTMLSSGAGSSDAEKAVQAALDIAASMFDDYRAAPGDVRAPLARMLVLTMQAQAEVLAPAVGTMALDGAPVTQDDVDRLVVQQVMANLAQLQAASALPAGSSADAAEAALTAAAAAQVADHGLTAAGAATAAAVLHAGPAQPETEIQPALQLANLSFSDADNFSVRLFTASLAQATPGSDGLSTFIDRRIRSSAGHLAKWGSGSDPWRQADLAWNGSAWKACELNHPSKTSARDANGVSSYLYCDREAGSSQRNTVDVAGQSMAAVLAGAAASGYDNLNVADAAVLGDAVFPAGAQAFYQTNTPLTESPAYYPTGAENAPGEGNVVTAYSAEVAAGGVAATQPPGTGCNSPQAGGSGSKVTTLEQLIASRAGTPCVFGPNQFSYAGSTYTSDTPNEWWSNASVSLGKVGTVALNSGAAPGYYSGNTLLRVAFAGGTSNAVTYYACKERFTDGSSRNCSAIGRGSFSIRTLGDARAMTFNELPAAAAALNYTRVFVERGGFVYYGYQSKPAVTRWLRLNAVATTALLTKLGIALEDPEQPLQLTAGSYQGTWDAHDATTAVGQGGTTIFIDADGSSSCVDDDDRQAHACTLSITNPATGAFTFADESTTASGTFDFLTGGGSGVYHDPTSDPVDGDFVVNRR